MRASLHRVSAVSLLGCACAAFGWTPPARVAATPDGSTAAHVVTDAQGNAHVVWHEGKEIVYSNNTGGAFSRPEPLTSGGGRQSFGGDIAVSGKGIYVVYFHNPEGKSANVYFRRKSGRDWTPAVQISDLPNCRYPWIAVARKAGPAAVWEKQDDTGTDSDVYYSELAGSSFSKSRCLSPNSPNGGRYGSMRPAVAISPNGDVTVVWSDSRTGAYRMYADRRVGGVWQGMQEIGDEGPVLAGVGVADGQDNQVHIAYNCPLSHKVKYQRWDGKAWTKPQELPGNISQPARVRVAVDDRGFVHAVCDDGGTKEVHYTTNASGSWQPWGNVSNTPNGNSREPDIAFGGGRLIVVWQESDNAERAAGKEPDIYYSLETLPKKHKAR